MLRAHMIKSLQLSGLSNDEIISYFIYYNIVPIYFGYRMT